MIDVKTILGLLFFHHQPSTAYQLAYDNVYQLLWYDNKFYGILLTIFMGCVFQTSHEKFLYNVNRHTIQNLKQVNHHLSRCHDGSLMCWTPGQNGASYAYT